MPRDREKLRKFQREWCAKNRTEWLEANGPCVRCGSSEEPHVDHIDPASKVHHRVWSWAPERRAVELAKCQVLCGPCHRGKTYLEQRGENNQTAKLTDSDVRQIHRRFSCGETGVSIATAFSISRREAHRIRKGERWAHIYAELTQAAA